MTVVAGGAGGAPALSLATGGNCPSDTDLAAALTSKGYPPVNTTKPVDFIIASYEVPSGALLVLRRGNGQDVLRRHFHSSDCRVLAEAMAVVVEAYFSELDGSDGFGSAPPPEGDPNDRARNDDAASADGQPAESAAETPSERDGSAFASPAQTKKPAPIAHQQKPQARSHVEARPFAYGRGFIGIGPLVELPSGTIVPEATLVGGADLTSLPLSIELVVSTGLSTTSGDRGKRVERWAGQELLRVAALLPHRLRYRPWAAVGAAIARLDWLDSSSSPTTGEAIAQLGWSHSTSSPTTSFSLLVGIGVEVDLPLAKNWDLGLDLGCLVLGSRDKYRGEFSGEIGYGPRFVCPATVGLSYGGMPTGK